METYTEWEEFETKYHKSFGEVNIRPNSKSIGKWPDTKYQAIAPWEVYLHHSCDEWEIGGLEEAKSFSDNLKEAIVYCEKNPLPAN